MQKLLVSYNTIKQVLLKTPSYYIQQGDNSYHVISITEYEQITSIIAHNETANIQDFESNYKENCTAVPSVDDAIVLGKIANNIPFVTPRNEDGFSLQIPEPRTGTELILVTHNFSDPTTWYTNSIRVNNATLTDSGDGYHWTSSHTNWIDLTHGKLFDEDTIVTLIDHQYQVIVAVNSVIKQQREPFATDGGDYDVNHVTGTVIFFESQAGKTITASFSYENGSMWKIIPAEGYQINIEQAEAQFSRDLVLTDDILFDTYVYNPNDLPNKILYDRSVYKRMTNFIDEAIGSYPVIPSIGGINRGTQDDVYGFPFRYGTVKKMLSSQGTELRVSLKNDKQFGGSFATATFYCSIKKE